MHLIDGKAIAQRLRLDLKEKVKTLKKQPHLVVVLATDHPASLSYVTAKEKAAIEVGYKSRILKGSYREEELLDLIDTLNIDEDVDGILVQLPLPDGFDAQKVIDRIDPAKDVDGFHPHNLAMLVQNRPGFIPATPKGIIRLLKEEKIELKGQHAVIVGRSLIVGKPLIHLLLKEDMSVTVAHSKSKDLKALTQQADLLIAAVGVPKLITKEMVKQGATLIDVGINRVDGKLIGDVDFEALAEEVQAITPVPGGVGPMTIYALLENTYEACLRKEKTV
jgi:methylenetetrahydrofolate dehydrogenase (NADP+) / methenyltetrahydrofolate cyclohydrolase